MINDHESNIKRVSCGKNRIGEFPPRQSLVFFILSGAITNIFPAELVMRYIFNRVNISLNYDKRSRQNCMLLEMKSGNLFPIYRSYNRERCLRISDLRLKITEDETYVDLMSMIFFLVALHGLIIVATFKAQLNRRTKKYYA